MTFSRSGNGIRAPVSIVVDDAYSNIARRARLKRPRACRGFPANTREPNCTRASSTSRNTILSCGNRTVWTRGTLVKAVARIERKRHAKHSRYRRRVLGRRSENEKHRRGRGRGEPTRRRREKCPRRPRNNYCPAAGSENDRTVINRGVSGLAGDVRVTGPAVDLFVRARNGRTSKAYLIPQRPADYYDTARGTFHYLEIRKTRNSSPPPIRSEEFGF